MMPANTKRDNFDSSVLICNMCRHIQSCTACWCLN